MISFNFDKYCYGCGACVDICPTLAITLQFFRGGFAFPKIDETKCIHCCQCDSVCPHLNAKCSKKNCGKLYSAKHKNEKIRLAGSSGSVFYALAKLVINRDNGFIVAAGFDSELQLRHMVVNMMQDVIPLMKSKYIQSSTKGIYKRIKSLLDDNVSVLFVGTPCQCQAVINYVPAPLHERLTVVDFVCHGVPSQDLFNRCIESYENQHNCKVIDVSFREKDSTRMRSFLIKSIDNNSGQETSWRGEPHEWSYYNGFLDHTTFRPSCFHCQFKKIGRNSDLTLGDFWGLDKICRGLNDFNKGYSMVVTNTEKGSLMINAIKNDLDLKQYPIQIAVDNNYAYTKIDYQSTLSRVFLKCYNNLPFCIVENLFLESMPPIFVRLLRMILRVLKV